MEASGEEVVCDTVCRGVASECDQKGREVHGGFKFLEWLKMSAMDEEQAMGTPLTESALPSVAGTAS